MVIKTDSQNYTNIANAIRELNGSTTQYKPEEMIDALDAYIPSEGISYDTFDSSGNVLTATIYGNKAQGLAGNIAMTSVTFKNNNINEIKDYAFYDNYKLSLSSLPNSIKKIGKEAFKFCYSLQLSLITFFS